MADPPVLAPVAAPVLSTPDTHIFDSYTPVSRPAHSRLSEEALHVKYEISRTISEIRSRRWERIALQFPDQLLPDAPKVFELLRDGLRSSPRTTTQHFPERKDAIEELELEIKTTRLTDQTSGERAASRDGDFSSTSREEKLYILGDTSYGACCVDETAAEHVSADAVVHYGRACLSPTARLPVLHIFTIQPLDVDEVVSAFETTYPDKSSKVLIVADVTYSSHVPTLAARLRERGYLSSFATEVVHDPASLIPNRTVPPDLAPAAGGEIPPADWHLFHVSTPPSALLLTLATRVASIRIYPTFQSQTSSSGLTELATPMPLLRRRYALLTRLRTASIIGILINTLSASSTLPVLSYLKSIIADAGKKSYTVVVGKVTAAKLANFAEVDGWVVVGCWESSLLEDDEGKGGSGWWKPCITPWELEAALGPEGSGIVGWRTDLESVLLNAVARRHNFGVDGEDSQAADVEISAKKALESGGVGDDKNSGPLADEEESEPPEFDLRTGRYVSNSRPLRTSRAVVAAASDTGEPESALTRRARGDLAIINGVASPGAAFLREKRTWQGLGSDFEVAYEDEQGGLIEEGRSGIARGYGEERRNQMS